MKGSSEKALQAHVLLKADVNGPSWTDAKIAEAFLCSTRTVEIIHEHFVTEGFKCVLNGKKCETPPQKKLLGGEQKAKIIAMRLDSPSKGLGS